MAQDLPDNMKFSEEFTDRAWQDMNKLLDQEMPVDVPESNRRGSWIWLLLLLWFCMGIGFICVLKDNYFAQYQEDTNGGTISENTIVPSIEPTTKNTEVITPIIPVEEKNKNAQIADSQHGIKEEATIAKENNATLPLPNAANKSVSSTNNTTPITKVSTPELTENTTTNTDATAIENTNKNITKNDVPSNYNQPEITTTTEPKTAVTTSPPPIEKMTLPEPPIWTTPPAIELPISPEEGKPVPPAFIQKIEENAKQEQEKKIVLAAEADLEKQRIKAEMDLAKQQGFTTPVELISDKMIAMLPEQAPILDREIEVKKERSLLPNYWTVSGGTRFYDLSAPNAYTAGLTGFYRLGKSNFLLGTGLHATYLNEPIAALQANTPDAFSMDDTMENEVGPVFSEDYALNNGYTAEELVAYQQKSLYAEVPIILNWAVHKRFQIQAGINSSLLLFSNPLNFGVIQSADENRNANRYTSLLNWNSNKSLLRKIDIAPILGVTFLPTARLGIDVRYQHGVIDLSDIGGAQINSNLQVGVSYWFGK